MYGNIKHRARKRKHRNNPTNRGRLATKLSVVVDDLGVPYSLLCTPANQSDMRLQSSGRWASPRRAVFASLYMGVLCVYVCWGGVVAALLDLMFYGVHLV